MTLLPSENISQPRLLCLKYYSADSDGWKDLGNCDICVEEYKDFMRPLSDCHLADVCSCNMFRRQPLPLLHSAAQVLFNDLNSNGLNCLQTQRTKSMCLLSVQTVCIFGIYFLPNILPSDSGSVSSTNSNAIVPI